MYDMMVLAYALAMRCPVLTYGMMVLGQSGPASVAVQLRDLRPVLLYAGAFYEFKSLLLPTRASAIGLRARWY